MAASKKLRAGWVANDLKGQALTGVGDWNSRLLTNQNGIITKPQVWWFCNLVVWDAPGVDAVARCG